MKIVKIGRSSSNDVVIQDNQVSRAHCQIIEDYGQFTIIDTNSTNGVFINGMRMRTNGQQPLQPTDIVRIGNTTLNWTQWFIDPIGNGTGAGAGPVPVPPRPEPGFSVLSLVSFIISMVAVLMTFITLLLWPLSLLWPCWLVIGVVFLVSLILASIGGSSDGRGTGFAVAADIVSGLGVVGAVVMIIVLLSNGYY
ncbi:MAG: FHA domain-containing protein [Alistipes sp.]|nr:FHA domain-containing protein [Alistipes sp.]